MTLKPVKPYNRLTHIEVDTPNGPGRMLVRRHYDASNISGSVYGLDWWRTTETSKRSLLRRVLNAFLPTS